MQMQDAFSCSPKARTDARIIANNERLLVPVLERSGGLLEYRVPEAVGDSLLGVPVAVAVAVGTELNYV